jgi:hypothetical protein
MTEMQQAVTEAVWSPAKLNKKLQELFSQGSTQRTVAALSGLAGDKISMWRHGWKMPRKMRALAVQKAIEDIFLVLEVDGRKNVNNPRALRRRLRELARKEPPG